MPFQIIVLKKYHRGSKFYRGKNIITFETPQDLTAFKNNKLSLVFRTKIFLMAGMEPKDELAIKKNLNLIINGKAVNKKFDVLNSHTVELTFKVSSQEIDDFITHGYFEIIDLPHIVDPDTYRVSVKDHKGKEHSLSEIHFVFPTTYNGIDSKGETLGIPLRFNTYYDSNLGAPENFLIHPPGTIHTLSYDGFSQDYSITMANFKPDEHITLISRVLDQHGIASYCMVPPSVLQKELIKNNQISFREISHDLPRCDGPFGSKARFEDSYDKIFLMLPSLFAGHDEFTITEHKVLRTNTFKYFKNPTQIFTIYLDEEAQRAWYNKEIYSSDRKLTPEAILHKSKDIHFYREITEHHPLRFRHNQDEDILGENTITRHIYDDEQVIHLMPHTHDIPQPVTLYEALPEDLQTKFYDMQFCLIQYNASLTVPDRDKAGYVSFKGQKLEPGRIHRDILSIDDLKETRIHPNHGGTYCVLAACTKDYMQNRNTSEKPELWTIYTEGKQWPTLRDKNGKALLAYPYKINY